MKNFARVIKVNDEYDVLIVKGMLGNSYSVSIFTAITDNTDAAGQKVFDSILDRNVYFNNFNVDRANEFLQEASKKMTQAILKKETRNKIIS